jgi:hypothetical protein
MTDTLALKLVLTPLLIAAASLAGRRWGQAVGGWLVGLPLTSGPVAFFLALEHGAGFAAAVAIGSLAGALAEAAFCVAYGWSARRGWPVALTVASASFAVVGLGVQRLTWPLPVLAGVAVVTLLVARRLVPRRGAVPPSTPSPRWDLPARMVVTTALVVALTGVAPVLGPRLSGVLASFPVYAASLTVFAHRQGAAPAVEVLRGLLLGLLAFAGFFVVLTGVIERLGVAGGFLAATGAALAIQAASLVFVVDPARS